MIKTAKAIQNNETHLSTMEAELEDLKESLKVAEENFLKEDENLIKTLAALENLALKPTEALFVQPLSPVEIIRSAVLLRETVPYLEENAEKIRQELDKIEAKKQKVEKQIKEISVQKERMKNEHEQMRTLAQKKTRLRNSLEIKSKQTAQEAQKLASQANDIRELFEKLEKERKIKEEQRRAERQRLAELEKEKNMEASSSDYLMSEKNTSNAFYLAKGKIPLPARGNVIVGFGSEQAKGMSSKGITLKTRNMAQVTAPFDGSVMFAGPFRGYGNLIIIDHGGGYVTLLSGLESVDCELGQTLLAGEPVGQMPQENEAKLYIELRKDSHPINPLLWMKS